MVLLCSSSLPCEMEVSPMLLAVLLIVAVLLVAYLLYALVNPEAFQ